ncbi:MAG TPA: hypothetical protein ENI72_02865, partial [Rhodospirillales bacterium]|nr:hypothetical protein [Rhodospirillales bacterium]
WLESFEIGVRAIDDDHRDLVEKIQAIVVAVEDERLDICPSLISSFLDAIRDHFSREEKILEKIGYPNIKNHVLEHGKLLYQADELRKMAGRASDKAQLQCFLNELVAFLLGDILHADVDFKSYIQEERSF